MVYLAIVNLGLILFDLTYLWLRPFYFQHLPAITRIYDPVKGIEPEPLTTEALALVDRLTEQMAAAAPPVDLEMTLAEIRTLAVTIVEDNPFERSGLSRSLVRVLNEMQLYLQGEPGGMAVMQGMTGEEGLQYFWSLQPVPERLPGRVQFFQNEVAPLMEVNFYRTYDLSGNLTDNFWKIDLPFLLIFAADFFIGWFLSIRRGTYATWFLYPIFH